MAVLEDVDAIVTDVRSLMDEASDGENKFWVDTEIVRWANEGAEKFTSFTRVLSKLYEREVTADDIKNDRELRLSPDFITFDEGGVLYNDKPIQEISLAVLDDWSGTAWRDHSGTSQYYYRRGDMIGFYPPLTAGNTVKFFGIERSPDMVAEDGIAPLSGDYRMIAFRPYVRDYAIAQCWYKKGEMGYYREKMREFKDGIALVNQIVHGEKNQVKRMLPSRRVGGRHSLNALNM